MGIGYIAQFGTGGDYYGENGQFAYVSVGSSFAHIAGHPAFKGFGDYIGPWESGLMRQSPNHWPWRSSRRALGPGIHRPWCTAKTLLIDRVNKGDQLFFPLYSPAEVDADPSLRAAGLFFIPGEANAPLAVVMAGGGFNSVASIQEAFPHAQRLHELGYNIAVLKYRVGPPEGGPDSRSVRAARAGADLARAMSMIADKAAAWQVDLDGYSMWGSSAGGWLAWQGVSDSTYGAAANHFAQPAAVILAYAAPPYTPDLIKDLPPLFVTAAVDDDLVPVEAIDRLVEDVRATGVDVEYRRAAAGGHGYGLGIDMDAEGWFDDAVTFWKRHRT
jgi:acetyl esterase/lipase